MVFTDQRFTKPSHNASGPTRFLYVSGVGAQLGTSREFLTSIFEVYGPLDYTSGEAIDLVDNRRFVFVSYLEESSAVKAFQHFQTQSELFMGEIVLKISVNFAVERVETKPPPEPECTSLTDDVVVPGLFVVENFLSENEENDLLSEFDSDNAQWKMSLQRRVQHYGFPFNYRTLMLDYTKPTPPLTNSCVQLGHRLNDLTSVYDLGAEASTGNSSTDTSSSSSAASGGPASQPLPLNQLTINEYWPGQGIASHTDTEACFGPVIFILNLGSGIVMNLTKNSDKVAVSDETTSITSSNKPVRKCVYLPQRSLLILSGEARYAYSHGISLRKYDKVNNVLLPRGRRISFTFRHALRPGAISSEHLSNNDIELDHVVKVYDNIAVHWNHTRGKRKVWWHRVKDFLDSMPKGTLLADVGSGDGKYFGINPNITAIGCDRSIKLLEVSRDVSNETFCCDAVTLPFVSDMFDATVCIAVLHHLSTVERRYAVLSELVRITRPGGQMMIQAWALEQGDDSKRAFETQDTMVPWKLNKRFLQEENGVAAESSTAAVTVEEKTEESPVPPPAKGKGKKKDKFLSSPAAPAVDDVVLTSEELDLLTGHCKHVKEEKGGDLVFQRYCHVYKEGELESLCSLIPHCVVEESGWDKGNWFVKLAKVTDERLAGSAQSTGISIPALKVRNNAI